MFKQKRKSTSQTLEPLEKKPKVEQETNVSINPPELIDISESPPSSPVQLPFMEWKLIEDNGESYNDKFRRRERKAVYRVHHNLDEYSSLLDYKEMIDNSYKETMDQFLENADDEDYYSAYIELMEPTGSQEPRPIFISHQKVSIILFFIFFKFIYFYHLFRKRISRNRDFWTIFTKSRSPTKTF